MRFCNDAIGPADPYGPVAAGRKDARPPSNRPDLIMGNDARPVGGGNCDQLPFPREGVVEEGKARFGEPPRALFCAP